MTALLRAYVVVLVLNVAVFAIAKPVFTAFMSEEDFVRRRNAWFVLTAAAFILPSFWLFVPVAMAVFIHAFRRDPNPAAVYFFFLISVPLVQLQIPLGGPIRQLFALDYLRLMSFAMLPVVVSLREAQRGGPVLMVDTSLRRFDMLICAYLLLQWVVDEHGSTTESLRQGFLLVIDVLVPYYMLSRCCRTPWMLREALACFALAALVLAPLAVIEYLKGWLLWSDIGGRWGQPSSFAYLFRNDALRAQATTGHSIGLGYAMGTAFAFWLGLRGMVRSRWLGFLGVIALCAGMIASLARGPWLAAAFAFVAYLVIAPVSTRDRVRAMGGLAALAAIALASPMGGKLISYLPFVGTVDEENVAYRQQLFEVSWRLILENPWFGTPFFLSRMEELRQGQGIIDLVNTFVTVALTSGFVGLALFVGFFVGLLVWTAWVARRVASRQRSLAVLGAMLVAGMTATLFVMVTTSFGHPLNVMAWALGALSFAYVRMCSIASFSAPTGTASSAELTDRAMVAEPWQGAFARRDHSGGGGASM